KRRGRKFVSVKPNRQGRYAIPELELEVAILDGWVRYWFRGRLPPLPADLQRELDEKERELDEKDRLLVAERRRCEELSRRVEQEQTARQALEAELAHLRAQLDQSRRE